MAVMVADVPKTVEQAIEELQARFLNLPREEATVERIFFQLQQAHWFYLDQWVTGDADEHEETAPRHLPHIRFSDFCEMMFASSPMLNEHCAHHADFRALFRAYCGTIPRCGTIMLNSSCDHMVMVRPHKGTSYAFPRGKINQDEELIDCAARETYEETGYNPRALLHPLDCLSVAASGGGFTRMFIAIGVPDDGSVEFSPTTVCEVDDVAWVSLDSMGEYSGEALQPDGSYKKIKTWGVTQFVRQLKDWLARRAAASAHDGQRKGGKTGRGGKGKVAGRSLPASFEPSSHPTATTSSSHPSSDPFSDPLNDLLEGGSKGGGKAEKGANSWSVSNMFAANAKLLGVRYTYDGNPHTFGDYAAGEGEGEGEEGSAAGGAGDGGGAAAPLPSRAAAGKPPRRSTSTAAATAAAGGGGVVLVSRPKTSSSAVSSACASGAESSEEGTHGKGAAAEGKRKGKKNGVKAAAAPVTPTPLPAPRSKTTASQAAPKGGKGKGGKQPPATAALPAAATAAGGGPKATSSPPPCSPFSFDRAPIAQALKAAIRGH